MESQSHRGRFIFTTVLSASFVFATAGTTNAAGLTLTPTPSASQTLNSNATATSPASTYAQQLEAFKVAQVAYQVALAKWKIDFVAWQASNKAAIDANNATFQLALGQFEADQKVRKIKRATIDSTFNTTLGTANAESKIAMSSAKTADQKLAIRKTFENAKTAAVVARKAALDALGSELVRPTKTTLITTTLAPVRPVEPIKPDRAQVAPKSPKPTKTEGSKKFSASPSATQKENSKS